MGMTGKQQTGEILAVTGHGKIVNLGAAVPRARVADAAPSLTADLSNVVPFARARRGASESSAPLVTIAAGDRPAPPPARTTSAQQFALAAGSILIHSTLFLTLWQMPAPMASVGIEVITVDEVLGATTAAGLAVQPSESETQESVPVEEVKQDIKLAEQDQAVAEEKVEEKPKETPPDPTVAEVEPLPDQPKPPAQKKQTRPSVAATASSGVGRGRSDATSNYRGTVAAHLARHKQYPSAARYNGSQGTGTVTFSIDGSGNVTAATIVNSTGASTLDQELTAMVRRSSPFPAPPGGQAMSFTVPVSFRLN
jgi:TonB family protein